MIVLSGASASGKTEAAKMLMVKYGIQKAITTTTRPVRCNEVNGKDYFFVSKEVFEQMIKEDRFVEHTLYNGNYYADDQIPKVDFRIDSENKTIEQVADEVYRLYWKKLKNIK